MSMLSISASTLNNLINFSTLQTALTEIVKALQNQDANISQIRSEMFYFTEQIAQLKNDIAHLEVNVIQQRPSRTEVEKMVDSLKNLNVGKMRQIEDALAMKSDFLSKIELLGMKVSDLEGKLNAPAQSNSSFDVFKFNEEIRKMNVLLSQKVDFEKLREVDMKVGRLDSQIPLIQTQIKDILSKFPKSSSSSESVAAIAPISSEEFEKLKKRLAEYESQVSQFVSKNEMEKNLSLLSDLGLKKLEKSEFEQFLKDMGNLKDKMEEQNQYIAGLKSTVRNMNDTIVSHVDSHTGGGDSGTVYMDEEGTAGGRVHYRCLICDKVNFRIAGTTVDGKYIPGLPPGRRTLLVGSDNHTYYGREEPSPPLSPTANSGFATERSSTKNTGRSTTQTTGSPLSNSVSDETELHWENSRSIPRKLSSSYNRPTSAGSALSSRK